MSNGQYPPPPPGAGAPPKPGLPTWAKVLIGCGCAALLLGAVGIGLLGWGAKKAAEYVSDPAKMAELIISQDPNLEVVENNKSAGTITVRDKTTGETTTFNYADITEGKFSVTGSDGKTATVDGSDAKNGGNINITGPDGQKISLGSGNDLPAWLPVYPNAKGETANYGAEVGNERSGVASQNTADDVAAVKAWYADYFQREGYTVKSQSQNDNGGDKTVLFAVEKTGIDLGVVLASSGGETTITLTYKGPK